MFSLRGQTEEGVLMTNKWIIKPAGGKKLEITVPDDVVIEQLNEIELEQLQQAIARWLEKEAQSKAGQDWCVGGCGVQV